MVRKLMTLLAMFGLVFTVSGCGSKPNDKEHQLQAEVPSYYLTAKEIGDGYKLRELDRKKTGQYSGIDFEMAECVQIELPGRGNYIEGYGYAYYENPDKRREVTLLVQKLNKLGIKYYGDIVTKMSYRYDKKCLPGDMWQYKAGDASWLVVQSNRVEGLSHDGFGLRMTEWLPLHSGVIPYPPTQKQLETDERILADSSVRAYGIIGDYLVTVYINTDTREQPSEEELKRLWDLQVEKILKHIEKEK